MNTEVIYHQLHLALLDSNELNNIAARIEEGASTDVMEVLAGNLASINDRQGIAVPGVYIPAVETFLEQKRLALEAVNKSSGIISEAIFTALKKLLVWMFSSTDAFEDRCKKYITDLADLRKIMEAKDQKESFSLDGGNDLGYNLADSKGVFNFKTSVNNFSDFDDFLYSVTKACSGTNESVAKIINTGTTDIKSLTVDLRDVAKCATNKNKVIIEHSFGMQTVSLNFEDNTDLKAVDFDTMYMIIEKQKVVFKNTTGVITVADAINAIDTCIKIVKNSSLSNTEVKKLLASVESLEKNANKSKSNTGSKGTEALSFIKNCMYLSNAILEIRETSMENALKELVKISRTVVKSRDN
jgi:hypothetical protein